MSETRTARTHNFDRSRWGHAQYLKFAGDDNGATRFSGLVISTPVVREGDFVEWATEYGRLRLLVESTKYVADPDDMVDVTSAVVVERLGHNGETLWPEPSTTVEGSTTST